MADMEKLGRNLRRLRQANNWSRERVITELARHHGCNNITPIILGYLERGRRATMPVSWLVGFASIYRVTTDALLSADCPGHHNWPRPMPPYMACRVCGRDW